MKSLKKKILGLSNALQPTHQPSTKEESSGQTPHDTYLAAMKAGEGEGLTYQKLIDIRTDMERAEREGRERLAEAMRKRAVPSMSPSPFKTTGFGVAPSAAGFDWTQPTQTVKDSALNRAIAREVIPEMDVKEVLDLIPREKLINYLEDELC